LRHCDPVCVTRSFALRCGEGVHVTVPCPMRPSMATSRLDVELCRICSPTWNSWASRIASYSLKTIKCHRASRLHYPPPFRPQYPILVSQPFSSKASFHSRRIEVHFSASPSVQDDHPSHGVHNLNPQKPRHLSLGTPRSLVRRHRHPEIRPRCQRRVHGHPARGPLQDSPHCGVGLARRLHRLRRLRVLHALVRLPQGRIRPLLPGQPGRRPAALLQGSLHNRLGPVRGPRRAVHRGLRRLRRRRLLRGPDGGVCQGPDGGQGLGGGVPRPRVRRDLDAACRGGVRRWGEGARRHAVVGVGQQAGAS
ncbi:hypothetical protein CI238_00676, partial [Colletotrichum incanum]